MKKIAVFLAALLLLFPITACERRESPSSTQSDSPLDQSESREDTDDSPRSREEEERSTEDDQREPAEDTDDVVADLQGALTALQSGEREEIERYMDFSTLLNLQTADQDTYNYRQTLRRMTYQVQAAEKNGSVATVTVRVTNIDISKLLGDYLREAMSMEQQNALSDDPQDADVMEAAYRAMFVQMLDQHSGDTVEKTVAVSLVESESGQWRIQIDSAFQDAVLGGFFDASSRVGESAYSG